MTVTRQTAPDPATSSRRWSPSDRLLRGFALAAAITQGGIAVTGATVRVTGSGLGCETWPECQAGTLIPEPRTGLDAIHQAIEFGNRTLTGVVLIAALGTFALLWLARDRYPVTLRFAAAGPVGVLFQAIWGGIVVRTELTWWTVAPHMLVSLGLTFYAIWVHQRLTHEASEARGSHIRGENRRPTLLARPLVVLTWVTVAVLGALCVAGTLVTAAGPHAGDSETPRLELPVRTLAQVHADLMFLYLGLIVALTVAVFVVRSSALLRRRMRLLIVVTVGQGLIGLVQYAIGVPEILVVAHVLGAVLLTAAAGMVAFAATRPAEESTPAPEPAV